MSDSFPLWGARHYIQTPGDKIIESATFRARGIVLVYREGDFCEYQVWSDEYDFFYGSFSVNKPEDIACKIKLAYTMGFEGGKISGREEIKAAFRKFFDISVRDEEG